MLLFGIDAGPTTLVGLFVETPLQTLTKDSNMKTVFAAFALSLISFSAFAQPIDLQPGTSIVINGDVISCLGNNSETLPVCRIKQDGYYYRVYVGETVAESFNSFEQALSGVKSLKAAGLCR
jgi:hypothetical protein